MDSLTADGATLFEGFTKGATIVLFDFITVNCMLIWVGSSLSEIDASNAPLDLVPLILRYPWKFSSGMRLCLPACLKIERNVISVP